MPRDCEEGDYVLFPGMGAYSTALSTGFNGYGVSKVVTVVRGLAGAEEFFSKSSTENAA